MKSFITLSNGDFVDFFSHGSSRFFVPVEEMGTSDSSEIREGFLYLAPEQAQSFYLQMETYLSLTLLSGEAFVESANFAPIKLLPFQNSGCFYIAFNSILGELKISNLSSNPAVLQIVGKDIPNPKSSEFKHRGFNSHVKESIYSQCSDLIDEGKKVLRISNSPVVTFGSASLQTLSAHLDRSGEVQGRVCCHPSDLSSIQEMFMRFNKGTSFPMMKHHDKSESLLILSGELKYTLLSHTAANPFSVNMNAFDFANSSTSHSSYIWIRRGTYHSPITTSELLLAKESTTGPFLPDQTETL